MKRHTRRSAMFISVVTIVALAVGLWPRSSSAARATLTLADANKSWSAGRFFRTGLALDAPNGPGGVQLVPTKVQTAYGQTAALPIPLSSHSSAVYNNRIFVLGGNTIASGNDMVKSNQVFSTRRRLDTQTGQLGQLEAWETLPSLAVNGQPVPLSDMATVVVTVNNKPYLVALGGMKGRTSVNDPIGLSTVTSSRIYFYPIVMDDQGVLGTSQVWRETAQKLPYTPNYDLPAYDGTGLSGGGAANIMAVSVMVNNTPYIYLFGGHNRYLSGGSETNTYYNTVFRAPVSVDGSGNLVVGNWDWTDGSVTIQDGAGTSATLAGGAVMTYNDPETNATGVYLVGGSNGEQASDKDANAYVARIDPVTGNITWLPKGNMSLPRAGHAGVQSDGMITITGGSDTSNTPTKSAALGYIEPDLKLYRDPFNPDQANFDVTTGGLTNARAQHTMQTLAGGTYNDFAYLIGGETSSGTATVPASTDVLYGNLDEPPQPSDNFVTSGKYYSQVFDFGDQAKYYSLSWQAVLPTGVSFTGNPIKMQYRVGSNPQDLGTPIDIPVTSVNGTNSYTLPYVPTPPDNQPGPQSARYFQFIANLTSNGSNQSPILDWVKLDVERNGFPNLHVTSPNGVSVSPNPIRRDSVIVPSVSISNEDYKKNVNGTQVTIKAINANWDGDGYFFVHLYVLQPGQTPPRADWPTFGDSYAAYAPVEKKNLPAGGSYTIPSNAWRRECPDDVCPLMTNLDWLGKFGMAGTASVYIMVDSDNIPGASFGNVVESQEIGVDGEADNVAGPFAVQVSDNLPKVFLAYVPNKSNSLSQQQAPVRKPHAAPRN